MEKRLPPLPINAPERKDVFMIQFKSDQGDIFVSSAVFSNITGMAATNCFGVKGMAYRSMTDGLVQFAAPRGHEQRR